MGKKPNGQKLHAPSDTPLAPGEPVSPEARARVQPAEDAVREAVESVQTPQEADAVARSILQAARGLKAQEVREEEPASPDPGKVIERAAELPDRRKAIATLLSAAEQVAGSSGETREALEQALQEALNPEVEGETDPATAAQRDLLRDAILERMRPLQAIDARLFLAINHTPHSPALNAVMSLLTNVMNLGFGWMAGLLFATLINRRNRRTMREVLPPLWMATLIVEYPIKYYFRRRRPFVDIVQAITIGRKPGTYSFPSGHSAAAFAGAWLLSRHYRSLTPLWYAIASLVGFSRIYLGVHYPGDVASGALIGTALAEASRRVIDADDACD